MSRKLVAMINLPDRKFTPRIGSRVVLHFREIAQYRYECRVSLTRWYNVIYTGHLLLPNMIAGPAE